MDHSKKSKFFTFGKLENNEDSDSEDSPYDSANEDSVSEERGMAGDEISSKTSENHQQLTKEMERLTCKGPTSSSSCSFDVYERRNYKGLHTDALPLHLRSRIHAEGQNLFGMSQRLRGNWTFRCDIDERNSDGLTEADTIWTAVHELHEKVPNVFFLKPQKFPSRENYININCYTPDYRDEEFILKTIKLLRERIYFPFVLYYSKSDWKTQSIYMHTPNGEFYRKNKDNRWEIVYRE